MKSHAGLRSAMRWASGFLVLTLLSQDLASAAEEGTPEDYLPNVTLITQDNKEVRFYDDLIKDKFVLINFFYTRCDGKLCDAGTRNLAELQKKLGDRLGRDVFIYSITFDPDHDTPEVLKKYAEDHGAKPGWLFLTGKSDDIETLRRKLGMTIPTVNANANATAVVNPKRHTGMIKIGNGATGKWTSTSVLAKPESIMGLIGRLKSHKRSTE
jgi:protein SCO1/2